MSKSWYGDRYEAVEGLELNDETKRIEDDAINDYEAKCALLQNASKAIDLLSKTFLHRKSSGAIEYPNDFAGMYISDGKARVAFTSLESMNQQYVDIVRDYRDDVIFEESKYSINDLNAFQNAIIDLLDNNIPLSRIKINPQTNKVDVILCNDDVDKAKNEIENMILSSQFQSNFLTRSEIGFDIFSVQKGTPCSSQNVYGGMSMGSRTVGACGTYSISGRNYRGVITAGHNLTFSSTLSINGVRCTIQEIYWRNEGNGDYALVTTPSSLVLTNKIYGTSTSTTRSIRGVTIDANWGDMCMTFGKTSGYAYGTVSGINLRVKDSKTGYWVNNLTETRLSSGRSQAGDSGGPHYRTVDGVYMFCGNRWGASSDGKYAFATPQDSSYHFRPFTS